MRRECPYISGTERIFEAEALHAGDGVFWLTLFGATLPGGHQKHLICEFSIHGNYPTQFLVKVHTDTVHRWATYEDARQCYNAIESDDPVSLQAAIAAPAPMPVGDNPIEEVTPPVPTSLSESTLPGWRGKLVTHGDMVDYLSHLSGSDAPAACWWRKRAQHNPACPTE